MEQQEALDQAGWCLKCTCRPHYHIGATKCQNCKCQTFELDKYRDELDKQVIKELTISTKAVDNDDQEEFEVEEIEISGRTTEIFMGKVSRMCSYCGEVKLYKEFNNSTIPEDICNYCLYTQSELTQLDDEILSNAELDELLYAEDHIIENEMAQYAAEERQELIDEFLRGLDE